jgi:hypothetical protein
VTSACYPFSANVGHARPRPRHKPAHPHAGPATPRLLRHAARLRAITAGRAAVELAYRDPTCAPARGIGCAGSAHTDTETVPALPNNIVEDPVSSRQGHQLHPRLSPLHSTLTPENCSNQRLPTSPAPV